jgi:hypothetical protein
MTIMNETPYIWEATGNFNTGKYRSKNNLYIIQTLEEKFVALVSNCTDHHPVRSEEVEPDILKQYMQETINKTTYSSLSFHQILRGEYKITNCKTFQGPDPGGVIASRIKQAYAKLEELEKHL